MIYFLQGLDGGAVKIGYTDNLDVRRKQLEAHYGRPLALLATMEGGREREAELHARFAAIRLGRTEQFRPAPDLMAFIGRPLLVGQNPDAVETMEPVPIDVRLRVDSDLHQRIQAAADLEGNSVAAFIRSAVVKELNRRLREKDQ